MFGFRRQQAGSLIGQLFQPAGPSTFGRDAPVWQVQAIVPGVTGVEHVRLVGRDNPTETRIVAVSVLTDPRRYRRVG